MERGMVSAGILYRIVETWKRDESPGNGLVDEEENEEIALVEREKAEIEGEGEGGVAAVALGGVGRDVEELGVDGDVGEHLDVGSEGNADVLDDGELDDARRTLQDRKPRRERVFFAVERLGSLRVIGVWSLPRNETEASPANSARAETSTRSESNPPDGVSLRKIGKIVWRILGLHVVTPCLSM